MMVVAKKKGNHLGDLLLVTSHWQFVVAICFGFK
jgi:hypothetical protein